MGGSVLTQPSQINTFPTSMPSLTGVTPYPFNPLSIVFYRCSLCRGGGVSLFFVCHLCWEYGYIFMIIWCGGVTSVTAFYLYLFLSLIYGIYLSGHFPFGVFVLGSLIGFVVWFLYRSLYGLFVSLYQ